MLNFVLIHGSWRTGAHWAPVVGHLHQAGHQAFAPTVLGHGEGVEKRVNHAQQVDDLVNQLVQRNLRDIVLVGHSYAGTLTARLAEEIPDRIRRLVRSAHSIADERGLQARQAGKVHRAPLSEGNPERKRLSVRRGV